MDTPATAAQQSADSGEAVAAAIERWSTDIVDDWMGRVREEVERSGRQVTWTDLRNAMDDYLLGLAQVFRSPGPASAGGRLVWKKVAEEHAVTRVRLGFDIDQLVREFVALRQSIRRVLATRGLPLGVDQTVRLTDTIDAAIAVAVRSYVDSRDYQQRQQQSEHIGFVTHELRNPLGAARLAASVLARDPAVVSAAGRMLALLTKNLERLQQLVDSVLLNEKLGAGPPEPRPTDVSAASLLETATAPAREEARQKGLVFEIRYDPDLILHIDPLLTSSAVQNLVDNAVKYTDEGFVQVAIDDEESAVVLHVRDSCGGLSEQELKTIFEPFRRGHTRKPGTGLGLAIARRAAAAQRGTIEAESTLDGCHFWMTLPKPPH
jgi:signal transduction histidine kinase